MKCIYRSLIKVVSLSFLPDTIEIRIDHLRAADREGVHIILQPDAALWCDSLCLYFYIFICWGMADTIATTAYTTQDCQVCADPKPNQNSTENANADSYHEPQARV